jgi:hypothetical protein
MEILESCGALQPQIKQISDSELNMGGASLVDTMG